MLIFLLVLIKLTYFQSEWISILSVEIKIILKLFSINLIYGYRNPHKNRK